MASVVGKTIFSDGKGKLFFGYYKDNDAVEFVDYKTWKKLSFKDVSKGDTNKDRVIKAILKNQKQFNKKVDFNMWAKQKKRTFEETMDWFIQNGWIKNINKGGIREGVEDVLSVNEEIKNWGTIQNVFVKFLQANTKVLAKKVQSKDEDGTKAVIKGIIDGLTNAQRSLKLESVNEDKKQIKDLVKTTKHEKLFYDVLSTMEKKYGKSNYGKWLDKSLKDFGENPSKYRTSADKEEKLFQLGSK